MYSINYVNFWTKGSSSELPDVQVGFRRGRGTRDQIASIHWIIEKEREFQKKKFTSASLTTLKPLTVWITTNCGKFLMRWEYQTILPASCKTYIQVKKQQLELDMEQQTGSKLGKEYVKAMSRLYIVTLLQFNSVQLLSCVQLFVTPWTAARQASLSITRS